MNKLAIPTILLATVMVAGMFAFMPVEQASTVHDSGAIITAGGAVLDADEDLNDRIVAGNDDDITITIGTDNNTPFIVHQIIACGDSAVNGDIAITSIVVDGDSIELIAGGLDEFSIVDASEEQSCMDLVSLANEATGDDGVGVSMASSGGDIVFTFNGSIAGDTLTSVKVVASVQSGANIEVESALVV